MAVITAWVAALLLAPLVAAGDEHPIEKVIVLLQGLQAKVEAEGKTEAVSFTKYEYWCKNSLKELANAIADEKANIDSLKDTVEGKTKEEETLTKQIEELETKIGKLEATATKAKDLRDEGADLYKDTTADFVSTIQAVDDAITALQGAKDETSLLVRQQVKTVAAFVQAVTTAAQRDVFTAFLSEDPAPKERPELKAEGDREQHVNKYQFKSGNVVELLKQLKAMFEDEKLAAEKSETNALNEYDLSKQARDAAKQAAEDSKSQKEKTLGDVQADLASAKEQLTNVEADLEADSTSQSDTKSACSTKKRAWEERSEIRSQELEAMAAAVKILAKVSGVRTEPPENPVPPPSPVSFLQVADLKDPKTRAVNLLRAAAKTTHSKALERLAQQLAVSPNGPFGEVINMIQKMIFRLMAEQKDEDDHKNWCDLEIKKSDESKSDKEDKVAELTTKIDDAKAAVEQLSLEITDANKMVADTEAFMKESRDIRKAGKEENSVAIKDASDAQAGISNAISVLEAFYKDSGKVPKEDWELLQAQEPGNVQLGEEPSTWDAGYTGAADPMGQPDGIIAVLKETSADFAKMEADTKAQEAMDQKEYEEEVKDAEVEKARRAKESEMKGQEKKRLLDKVDSMTKAKKHTSDELESVQQYIIDLQPACVEGDSTYEDRKAARTTEIDALKKVQSLLTDAFKEPKEFLQAQDVPPPRPMGSFAELQRQLNMLDRSSHSFLEVRRPTQ